ncbi:hypothetical protein B0J13DRAFT_21727 [Dactylonectria estremocensis]|uniref:Uncharacterized protein n=1 Tax=Dactylonectria estremocensis TaxID=1079267 RepID=A0A9P9FIF9_9HYPO|nr:hypothetical protein B0J13DRAFT_21727 [Dactylonectria estremocensis]
MMHLLIKTLFEVLNTLPGLQTHAPSDGGVRPVGVCLLAGLLRTCPSSRQNPRHRGAEMASFSLGFCQAAQTALEKTHLLDFLRFISLSRSYVLKLIPSTYRNRGIFSPTRHCIVVQLSRENAAPASSSSRPAPAFIIGSGSHHAPHRPGCPVSQSTPSDPAYLRSTGSPPGTIKIGTGHRSIITSLGDCFQVVSRVATVSTTAFGVQASGVESYT